MIKSAPGGGVSVSGSGSSASPYLLGLQTPLANAITVADTATLDLQVSPQANGVVQIYGNTLTKLSDLKDVADPEGAQVGDVPVWMGTHWEFRPPTTVAPGVIQTANGISGDGSISAPISAKNSGTFGTAVDGSTSGLALYGTDSTLGQPIYVDTNGQLRAAPEVATVAAIARKLADLPGTYPIGMSITQITSAQATAGGWPSSGQVVTFRRAGETNANAVCAQYFYSASNTTNQALYRQASSGVWSAWSTALVIPDDTGWVNITVNGGFAGGTAPANPQCRRIGNQVWLRGQFTNTGISAVSDYTVGVIPAGFRPPTSGANPMWLPASSSTSGIYASRWDIDPPTGNLRLRIGSTGPTYYTIDKTYLID